MKTKKPSSKIHAPKFKNNAKQNTKNYDIENNVFCPLEHIGTNENPTQHYHTLSNFVHEHSTTLVAAKVAALSLKITEIRNSESALLSIH